MKRYFCVSLFLTLFLFAAAAQSFWDGLLFSQFQKGVIKYRNGTQSEALVNYNTLEEEFLFVAADNTILGIAAPQSVDIITVGKRNFIPAEKDAFYEIIKAGPTNFFVQWKSKLISKGRNIGYGGTSSASAVSNVGVLRQVGATPSSGGVGIHQRIITDEQFKANTECIYYIVINNKFQRFTSLKTFTKLFKNKKAQIREFANTHSIKFDEPDQVALLVEYTFNL